jgi:hypothetical protein
MNANCVRILFKLELFEGTSVFCVETVAQYSAGPVQI